MFSKDKQPGFSQFDEALAQMAQSGEQVRKVHIPADGNWFKISFDAIEQKKDRLLISAKQIKAGMGRSKYDPSAKEYVIEFEGTRAAYLKAYYQEQHRRYGWPYISWDIRSYATLPQFSDARVYVESFRAHAEIKKLIQAMEAEYGSRNILIHI